MKNIVITRSNNSPRIILDPENRSISIKGRSNTCYTRNLYAPALSQIALQFAGLPEVNLSLSLVHANTASVKWISEILEQLEIFQASGTIVTVIWNYEADDIDMMETGEVFQVIHQLPFVFNPVEANEFYNELVAV